MSTDGFKSQYSDEKATEVCVPQAKKAGNICDDKDEGRALHRTTR